MMWLTILEGVSIGLLIPLIIFMVKTLRKHTESHKWLESSNKAQMRQDMKQIYDVCAEKGYKTHYDQEAFYDLHGLYKQKDGNGSIDKYEQLFDKLKLKGE